jgi:hypothetical protein
MPSLRLAFHPIEWFLLRLCAALAVINGALLAAMSVEVDWPGYVAPFVVAIATLAGGLAYRRSGRSERIGLALIATGLFILFTLVASVFNYLLIPYVGLRIDPWLIEVDHLIGFEWRVFVERMSFLPILTAVLGVVYATSLPQLALLVLVLGFGGHRNALHRFLLTGVFGALGAILFWSVFPTSGPSAFVHLPPEVLQRVWLIVEPSYGVELNELMAHGPTRLSPSQTLGLIGLPSYHTVMALMSVWFIPRMPWLFWPVFALNVAMLPAIVLHGGHHLVDVFGGFAMFFLALRLADWTAQRLEDQALGNSLRPSYGQAKD